jgi:acetyl-CoA carboxylase biotin carboxylase subunit
VTEMITGLDLVREQIRIAERRGPVAASGRCRVPRPRDRMPHQCRGSAHLPALAGVRSPTITPPGGMHVRVDSGLYAGYSIPPYYDSMIAKLIVYGTQP